MQCTKWWVLAPLRVSRCMQLLSLCSRDCSLTACFQGAQYVPSCPHCQPALTVICLLGMRPGPHTPELRSLGLPSMCPAEHAAELC